MQFKTTQELKDFIIWAKEQKIEAVKVGEIEFRFNAVSFIPGIEPSADYPEPAPSEYKPNSKTWTDVDQSKDTEDEDLFWSAGR